MTRLEQARAMQAKRQQTRAAIRLAIDGLVEKSGHKPAATLMMCLETIVDDLQNVSGAKGALLVITHEKLRIERGDRLDA